ncbi:DNA polymerase eta [Contarinia nasturtii]|uniref:DNA polymerase eta n=1 Tax=Contarinia nasturtii TaxID=265458 RepID=UPI0012D495E1|nr:DNA polymerase eta [Contarinia nasturtii]
MSKPQTSINNKYDRLIALIDMDCFYCQVEEQLNPELKGKPIAVVQYNAWRGGGIIAVNYPARAKGVTRHMRGDEAKEQCEDIELVKVPNIREKADLSKYRNAGKQVATVLQTYTPLLTRASVDEAYLDLTEQVQKRLVDMNKGKFSLQPNALKNTYVVGYDSIAEYVQDISERISTKADEDNEELAHVPEEDRKAYRKSDIKLLIASSIVSEIRAAVKEQTGYECSAGIAHNKILAKLVCGMNKPNKQTILPLKHIPFLFKDLPVRKVQGLGGKFGERICEDLGIQHMGDLVRFSKEELQRRYDERNGQWLYNISRGIDLEAVTPRLVSKSIGCCKKFPGRNAITAITTLQHWLHELAKEITERLEQDEIENNRRPKQMVVSFIQTINNADVSSSRTVNLVAFDEERLVGDAMDVLKRNTDKFFKSADNCHILNNPIKFLGLNVGKFESTEVKKGNTIQDMFQRTIENKKNQAEVSDKLEKNIETSSTNADVQEHAKEEKAKKEEPKESFIAEYYRMKQVKLAEEAARKAEEEGEEEEEEEEEEEDATTSDTKGEPEHSDEENTFNNEMLMDELEEHNQTVQQTERSSSPVPSTSTKVDYLQTYAEFYRPPDLPKVECEQCGKKVMAHELQIHNDEHFAFALTQEQRAEFQSQLKRNITSTTPAAKKQKTSSKNKITTKTPTKSTSIQKFFSQPSQADTQTAVPLDNTADETVETEKCTECGKNIPIVELFEHADYHAAKKLQDELMKAEMNANRTNNNTIQNSATKNVNNGKGKKSKKKATANSTANNAPKAMKNITSFFQNG